MAADPTGDSTIDGRPVRLDAFHDGGFAVFQPKGWGYRSGLDAMLLCACVAPGFAGRIADLGAGSGVVGFGAALRAPEASVALVEAQPIMASLCRQSLALPQNAHLARRIAVAEIDIGSGRPSREAAGLGDSAFDLVLTNPPFHPANHRRPPDPVRERALFPADGMSLGRWFAVAAALLAPKGRLVAVLRTDRLGEVLQAIEPRFGEATVLPVHGRAGAPAERVVVAARKGTRAPLRLLEGIALDDGAGGPTALSGKIARGIATLPLAEM
ncbi:tRNA1(Val) (adenine(37)-N6)-methyltransferase [Jiella avicenniae]|uniref:Methyltransferase n=1 Tax=Jiella avicenniae TaxID=2907202 RepID=A0A9X1NZI4_9HYPH|nr:methyltransferase [Jiella avicenniae]MCE7027668.1 methyltransferase [Jiella avicenniae]MCE7028710.1 methyltransferase [Jiella avicenniae]